MNLIKIKKLGKRAYGMEYEVIFYRNGDEVYRSVMFGNDLRSVRHAYTRDFANAEILRLYK